MALRAKHGVHVPEAELWQIYERLPMRIDRRPEDEKKLAYVVDRALRPDETYLTNLTIETAHYGWDSNMPFEASLRAKLGLQPALTLVQPQESGEEPAGEEDAAAPLIAQN